MNGSLSTKSKSVTARLVSLIVFPLLALLLTSGWMINDSLSLNSQAKTTLTFSQTAVKSSALVHELQKERGMSAGFLGSNGLSFRNDLKSQRKKTDQRLAELAAFLKDHDVLTLSKDLSEHMEGALMLMDEIDALRQGIDTLSTDIPSAIGPYTRTNTFLINVITLLPAIAPNSDIARQSIPYLNLIYMKEKAGIERAVLAGTFGKNQFSKILYEKFVGLVAKQNTFQSLFEVNASPEANHLLKQALSSSASASAESMRQRALDLGMQGGFNIKPKIWFEAQTAKINELKSVEDQLALGLYKSATSIVSRTQTHLWIMLAFVVCAIVGTVVLGGNIVRRLCSETNELAKALGAIASGDLTDAGIDYNKMGGAQSSLQSMRQKLTQINAQIKESVDTLTSASREISDKNHSLATRAEEQGQHLECTSAGMEEITVTVKQNATDAKTGNTLANSAMNHATKGQSIVTSAVTAMAEINEDSKKIAEIINVIDDIAFQTNLLALNAAVEAARAGEQGRGFAVVATEVRNLAQRSANAAHEIKGLIETSVSKVEKGSELVNASGSSLKGIVEAVEDCKKLMDQIASASIEQAKGVEKINDNMGELDSANQQNTAMVQEVAVSSRELQSQAQKLSEITSFYKVDENRTAFNAPTPPRVNPSPAEHPAAKTHEASTSQPAVERRSADRAWGGKESVTRAPKKKEGSENTFKAASGGEQDWTRF